MFSISPSALLRYARSRSSCARTLFDKRFSITIYMVLPLTSCKVASVAQLKFILRMFYSIMSFSSIINQAIISLPAIRVYSRAIKLAILRQYGYQLASRAVFNYLGINFAISFKHSEYRCFICCSSTSLTSYSFSSEVTFINLKAKLLGELASWKSHR